MAKVQGSTVIARALKQQGVDVAFGLVGVPIAVIASALQEEGVRFVGTRHEQAAIYAAQCTGYLTRKVGVGMTVSGPGMTNAVTGLANAWANCWPLLVLGGASELSQKGMGGFEEMPQIEAARPYVKWAAVADNVARIPYQIAEAMRVALYGRPGPVYLELPGDIVETEIDEDQVLPANIVGPAPRPQALPEAIDQALAALRTAQRPLVIVGKGAAYSGAEDELRRFIDVTQLPWLATPMGKGLIPDDHPLSTAACRTYVLQNTDLVLLVGARLNWQLHFGLPPRFSPGLRVLQVDIAPEEIGHNVPAEVGLVGDAKAVMTQLNQALEAKPWRFGESGWMQALEREKQSNIEKVEPMLESNDIPMNYYRMLRVIRDLLPRDAFVVAEGASTMDISRQVLNTYEVRHRIDAGTLGTMGCGPGFALATQLANPDSVVLDLEGDSAFGFDGMEAEVAVRHRLPIIYVVVNNNGIGGGPEELDYDEPLPPNAFVPGIRYDKIMEAFGGLGFNAETPEEFHKALEDALKARQPSLINVKISPQARRRPQQFAWRTPGARA